MSDKKYELTDETIEYGGHTLHRIKALRGFGNVKIGELGGFIEKEDNLSHEGDCWVYDNAKVYGDAKVYKDAKIRGNAEVFDEAQVTGHAKKVGSGYEHRKRKGKAMDKYNNLTEEDIKILKKMGFIKDDFKQIDKSYAVTRYAIFKGEDIDRCIIITPEKAKKLLGDKDFLEGLTRSSFHWSTSLEIKGVDGYTVDFDSSELFRGKASGFTKLPSLKETYEDILRLKEILEGKISEGKIHGSEKKNIELD